jgi:hypothetical protein
MKIRITLFVCAWSYFTVVSAQNQDPTPEALRKFEANLEKVCLKLKDDYPALKSMRISDASTICSCALPFTVTSVAVERIKDGDRVYTLLAANYFKCGESKIKKNWISHLKNKNKKLSQSQYSCIADHQYEMFLNYFESRVMTSQQELDSKTALCR